MELVRLQSACQPGLIFWTEDLEFTVLGYRSAACVSAKSLQSCPTLCNPVDCSPPGSSVRGFSRLEYWSGVPCPPPGNRPNPGIKPASLMPPALTGGFVTTSATWEAHKSPAAEFKPKCAFVCRGQTVESNSLCLS